MSRTKYLRSLQREFEAMQEVLNELLRENYELKTLLTNATPKSRQPDRALAA